jgi:hypothetical protein
MPPVLFVQGGIFFCPCAMSCAKLPNPQPQTDTTQNYKTTPSQHFFTLAAKFLLQNLLIQFKL